MPEDEGMSKVLPVAYGQTWLDGIWKCTKWDMKGSRDNSYSMTKNTWTCRN